jgi:hypothetical protein
MRRLRSAVSTALVPGTYTLTFTLSGMQTVTRKADAQLGNDTRADAKLGVQGVTESITVTAPLAVGTLDATSAKAAGCRCNSRSVARWAASSTSASFTTKS